MPEFLTNSIFLAVIGGFLISYVYQIVISGPREADRNKRVEEYMGRLSVEGLARIESAIAQKDKIGAIKIFREETNVGLAEAKESVAFIIKEMRKKS